MYRTISFSKRMFFFVMMVTLVLPQTARAQIEIGLGYIAGNELLSSFWNKVDGTIQQATSNVDLMGNAYGVRLSNQLYVASQNLQQLLDKSLDKRFDQLDTKTQIALVEVEKLRRTVEDFKSTAFDLRDATVLDLQTVIGNIVPWAKTDFLIQQINGVTQFRKDADYKLKFMGIGFGANSDKLISQITTVLINGKAVTNYQENKLGNYTSYIVLPKDEVNANLNATGITVKKVSIKVVTIRKKCIRKVSKERSLTFYLTIFPDHAGVAKVSYTLPQKTWVTKQANYQTSYVTPDHHQTSAIRHYFWTDYRELPEGQRFINAHVITRQGTGCAWTSENGIFTEHNDKQLRIWGETWGQPCIYFYGADIQEERITSTSTVSLPDMNANYGTSLSFDIESDVKYWTIDFTSVTGQKFQIVNKGSYLPLIEFSDVIDISSTQKRIIYKVNRTANEFF